MHFDTFSPNYREIKELGLYGTLSQDKKGSEQRLKRWPTDCWVIFGAYLEIRREITPGSRQVSLLFVMGLMHNLLDVGRAYIFNLKQLNALNFHYTPILKRIKSAFYWFLIRLFFFKWDCTSTTTPVTQPDGINTEVISTISPPCLIFHL